MLNQQRMAQWDREDYWNNQSDAFRASSGRGNALDAYVGLGDDASDAAAAAAETAAIQEAYAAGQAQGTTPTGTAAPAATPAAGGWLASIGTAVSALAPALTSFTQSSQLAKLNAQRAAQGLPPLASLPTVTAQVGLAPSTITPLLYIAGGIGAVAIVVALLMRKKS